MTIEELKEKLSKINVKETDYSLDGTLKPDAIILYKNYYKYEVFYMDERGGRNEEKVFTTEQAACDYIYYLLKN